MTRQRSRPRARHTSKPWSTTWLFSPLASTSRAGSDPRQTLMSRPDRPLPSLQTTVSSGDEMTNRANQVAVYARYSTDRQDSRSIDDQIRRCRAYSDARGFQVVDTYSDAAVSGSHMEREHLQRLLADAGRRRFDCVLVDDLSRLSRDLGATWRIVFEDLAVRGVRVVDCTTGMASDSAGARLTFGALALVNDTFLQLVRAETHRGLEGRALAGFATGGKTSSSRMRPATRSRPSRPR
jgi:DNA invertase Pin-like site-specific DNA recombinase